MSEEVLFARLAGVGSPNLPKEELLMLIHILDHGMDSGEYQGPERTQATILLGNLNAELRTRERTEESQRIKQGERRQGERRAGDRRGKRRDWKPW